jgi:GMP synthase-like glutamine amidotransferase
MHLDAVMALPAGAEVIGSSEKCEAQLVYQQDRLLGIQGHPEVNGALVAHMLEIRLRERLISRATYNAAMAKIEASHDGDKLAAFVHRFLRQKPSQVA